MVLFAHILVPIDGSTPSNEAVALATTIARVLGSRMTLCHVVQKDRVILELEAQPFVDPAPLIEGIKKSGRALLDETAERAADRGIAAKTVLVDGQPVGAIVELAREHGADLIVIGTHGRRGLSRLLLGSVAEGVIRQSEVPVLVVRVGEEERAARDA